MTSPLSVRKAVCFGSLHSAVCKASSLCALVAAMSGAAEQVCSEKIAVFADLHYTAESGRLKGEVLRWAVGEAAQRGAAAIVCAGDMVGNGRRVEAEAVSAILSESTLSVSFTPGNAELRCPEESAEALSILAGAPPPDGVSLVDSSRGWGGGALDERALPADTLVVTHVPPPGRAGILPADADGSDAPPCRALVVAGHLHRDLDALGLAVVRGLDPDKALGGPPAFALFKRGTDGSWRRAENVVFPGVAPEEWPEDFRRDFFDDLGIATMGDPFGGLDFAISSGVRCVELRARSWKPEDFDALRGKVREWRASGGRVLSIHLPEPSFSGGEATGLDRLRDSCRDAVALGCDRATLHVPKIPAAEFDSSRAFLRDSYADALAPLAGTGIAIGVENMHVTAKDREDWPNRRFGYTPEECEKQMTLLKEIPGLNVGFHLDIGHARNNAPFSTQYPIGAWYELLGDEVNGMHLHQISPAPDGTFQNHRPLRGFFDPLVSLSSLVMARQRGILPHAPMFLEIRDGLSPESWSALHALANGAVMSSTH